MNKDLKIVGLIGRYNSGKDTAANMFVNYKFKKLALAQPLKELLHEHFEVPAEELFGESHQRSPRTRKMLQHLGTDFALKFDPDIWIKKLIRQIEHYKSKHDELKGIVVSDVRFPNEAQAILDMKGTLIKIIRPNYDTYVDDTIKNHYSEIAIDEIPDKWIFITINNKDNLEEFKMSVEQAIKTVIA